MPHFLVLIRNRSTKAETVFQNVYFFVKSETGSIKHLVRELVLLRLL